MHGAGNDYIYINAFDESLPGNLPNLARRVSDRHCGIGGDGLVLILPSREADAEMRMFNTDGSEAEMCGNALRCVAWFLRNRGLCDSDELTIVTPRGLLTATVLENAARTGSVRIDMGQPILAAADIPTTLDPCVGSEITVGDSQHQVTCVSMGNPHCVLFCNSVDTAPVRELGPQLESHTAFPNKTNVGFAEISDRSNMRLRVWERGTGETLACGTGACAAVVAAVLNDLTDRSVTVSLPGGSLDIEWPEGGSVLMTGPVAEVFHGIWLG